MTMTIALDHFIVSAHDRKAAARQLAALLDVPWEETSLGRFSAVHINSGLTLDFIETDEDFPVEHFCFRVDDATFDAILARLQQQDIAWKSDPFGPFDNTINTGYGGRGIYWNVPEGHQWEILTASYARQAA